MLKHSVFYISNKENKTQLTKQIISGAILAGVENLRCAQFSERAINRFIEEETCHEHFDVITKYKNSLEHASQGERRKALLNHIFEQNPECIIVDNVFDSLDLESQKTIVDTLERLSEKCFIIQLTHRKGDILSFIKTIYKIEKHKPVLIEESAISNEKNYFIDKLPTAYVIDSKSFKTLIHFNNVSVSYGNRTIVSNINWSIKPGEFWHLIGSNGAGKSTLLSLIFGDNPKAYGQDLTLFGFKKGSGESVWDIKKHIGFFSSDMLRGFKRADSIENMIISGFLDSIGLYKNPSDRQILLAHQWLKLLNMFDQKDKSFKFLSNGYKRLVLIARAMVKQPPLLILDEPTNGLDDYEAKVFSELINKIARESDTAILYVSHRSEPEIKPDFIYQLTMRDSGSTGRPITLNID